MLYKSNHNSLYSFAILLLLCLCSCQNKEVCSKFIHEKYTDEQINSEMAVAAVKYRKDLFDRFDEESIEGLNHEAYHLHFFSSLGYGRSIKFERKNTAFYLSVKCIASDEWVPCKSYQTKITEEEWRKLEEMVYEFNFWTESKMHKSNATADGHTFSLEGNRPEAKKCNKRTHHFIIRSSPKYDKAGALCEYIFSYERELASSYDKEQK